MGSVNKVILIGNLTRDPEVKFTGQGTALATFSVATSETYKDKSGQKQEKTEFTNITAWSKLAELCGEYLQKGSQVYVEGRLQTDKVEKDGETKYYTKVIADKVTFLSRTKGKGGGDEPADESGSDDVPF